MHAADAMTAAHLSKSQSLAWTAKMMACVTSWFSRRAMAFGAAVARAAREEMKRVENCILLVGSGGGVGLG
jgi:hypothetical protein